MGLNQYAAETRLAIFADLKAGKEPSLGAFDASLLREAKTKGTPLVGTTRYEPDRIHFEFIYPDPKSTATIVTVTLESPERIIMLPVPEWVVESIWQGEISGSYHFESDAKRLVEAYLLQLEAPSNQKWFGPQPAKRRE